MKNSKTVIRPKMPNTIILSGRRVRMLLESPALNMSIQGLHSSWNNTIHLDSSMAPDQLKSIAVHEILHDLDGLVLAGLGERGVTALATVLFAAMRDNPALVEWLMSPN